MFPKLPKWFLPGNRPTYHDTESVTVIEAIARLHGTVNELIEVFNSCTDKITKEFDEFKASVISENQVFATAIRQEMQDFMDTVEIEIETLRKALEDNNKVYTLDGTWSMNTPIDLSKYSFNENVTFNWHSWDCFSMYILNGTLVCQPTTTRNPSGYSFMGMYSYGSWTEGYNTITFNNQTVSEAFYKFITENGVKQ